jgi:Uma2 family endonuclease
MPPPPSDFHQSINGKLFIELERYVGQHKSGVARISPLPVRLWEGKIREPDVVFLSNEHIDRRGEQFWGPPDLVMEVISPSTRVTDRRDKYQEYAQAGVSEYWLIGPRARTVEVYFLEGSVYAAVGTYRSGESARSKLLNGFAVNLKKLFAD